MERNFLIYQAANDAALQVSSFMFVFFIHGHGSKKRKIFCGDHRVQRE